MKNSSYLPATVVLILFLGVAAAQTRPGIVGKWRAQDDANTTFQFNADGTGLMGKQAFQYTVAGDKLDFIAGNETVHVTFALTGNNLIIVLNGQSQLFTRESATAETIEPEATDPLVGVWKGTDGTADIRDNGTMILNGEALRYSVRNNTMTLSNAEGSLSFPYTLKGDVLTVTIEGEKKVYRRQSRSSTNERSTPDRNGVRMEMVGKWCYMSNVNASGGGRMSNRCFTLYENGTYGYYAETSSSGAYGSTASQESDGGTWSATDSTITAYSRSQGKLVFNLQKRNHPKTGDPMLVLDGDAFVTATRRSPW